MSWHSSKSNFIHVQNESAILPEPDFRVTQKHLTALFIDALYKILRKVANKCGKMSTTSLPILTKA